MHRRRSPRRPSSTSRPPPWQTRGRTLRRLSGASPSRRGRPAICLPCSLPSRRRPLLAARRRSRCCHLSAAGRIFGSAPCAACRRSRCHPQFSFTAFTSAPCVSSVSMVAVWPNIAATCSGVLPKSLFAAFHPRRVRAACRRSCCGLDPPQGAARSTHPPSHWRLSRLTSARSPFIAEQPCLRIKLRGEHDRRRRLLLLSAPPHRGAAALSSSAMRVSRSLSCFSKRDVTPHLLLLCDGVQSLLLQRAFSFSFAAIPFSSSTIRSSRRHRGLCDVRLVLQRALLLLKLRLERRNAPPPPPAATTGAVVVAASSSPERRPPFPSVCSRSFAAPLSSLQGHSASDARAARGSSLVEIGEMHGRGRGVASRWICARRWPRAAGAKKVRRLHLACSTATIGGPCAMIVGGEARIVLL